ncbi:uncharacterized protein A1O5_08551 [Cladophialophora psammophila CBS 110553]|uniref:Fumarylacetoacetase n=1 Tax=Cladophialophora psammophila CBS 110553 TaxID=1182543 RepID=W9WIJ2_9EURO|nr:uncharacterized protein A1O5_08551 [Cladophialophora psammophila CBS 110553]EXJ67937.1 hypothetical protein A1O5_08551 [Cladophialophora psammophila CBS 110553]
MAGCLLSSCQVTVHRRCSFFNKNGESKPHFQISRKMKFEIELGAFISRPVLHGNTINAKIAADHIFVYLLHNDWSARDIQAYEMPPLGPVHAKGFITTISPWIIKMIAYQSSPGWGLNTGDLTGSGTISSPAPEVKKGLGTYGCLLEVVAQKHKLPAVGGKPMSWLEDGDRLTIEGFFTTADGSKGGFGGLSSVVVSGPS